MKTNITVILLLIVIATPVVPQLMIVNYYNMKDHPEPIKIISESELLQVYNSCINGSKAFREFTQNVGEYTYYYKLNCVRDPDKYITPGYQKRLEMLKDIISERYGLYNNVVDYQTTLDLLYWRILIAQGLFEETQIFERKRSAEYGKEEFFRNEYQKGYKYLDFELYTIIYKRKDHIPYLTTDIDKYTEMYTNSFWNWEGEGYGYGFNLGSYLSIIVMLNDKEKLDSLFAREKKYKSRLFPNKERTEQIKAYILEMDEWFIKPGFKEYLIEKFDEVIEVKESCSKLSLSLRDCYKGDMSKPAVEDSSGIITE